MLLCVSDELQLVDWFGCLGLSELCGPLRLWVENNSQRKDAKDRKARKEEMLAKKIVT